MRWYFEGKVVNLCLVVLGVKILRTTDLGPFYKSLFALAAVYHSLLCTELHSTTEESKDENKCKPQSLPTTIKTVAKILQNSATVPPETALVTEVFSSEGVFYK